MVVWQNEFATSTCGTILQVLYVYPSFERTVPKETIIPEMFAQYNVIITIHNHFGCESTDKGAN